MSQPFRWVAIFVVLWTVSVGCSALRTSKLPAKFPTVAASAVIIQANDLEPGWKSNAISTSNSQSSATAAFDSTNGADDILVSVYVYGTDALAYDDFTKIVAANDLKMRSVNVPVLGDHSRGWSFLGQPLATGQKATTICVISVSGNVLLNTFVGGYPRWASVDNAIILTKTMLSRLR